MTQHSDSQVQQVRNVLGKYDAVHREASIEVYRQNSASIRVRIVDADFHGLDRIEREDLVWEILNTLPEAIQSQITLLLLLTPEETIFSFVNFEFDNPLPSRP